MTWQSGVPPDPVRLAPGGWLRLAWRVPVIGGITFGGLALLLLLRLIERPLFGMHRPWTPFITQGVCRAALALMGMQVSVVGTPLKGAGAEVANHGSWLDIFVLNGISRIYFVAKSEVAGWAGIGWLARATGTVFIRRDRREAAAQAELFRQRLAAGHRLLFFPEGTSSDTRRVLPFKSTLFEAFFEPGLRERTVIQPVTVSYAPPPGRPERFYGWWGGMDFGPHLLMVLSQRRQGSVTVTYHPPVAVASCDGRKALAAACEAAVRSAHPSEQGGQTAQVGDGVGGAPELLAQRKEIRRG